MYFILASIYITLEGSALLLLPAVMKSLTRVTYAHQSVRTKWLKGLVSTAIGALLYWNVPEEGAFAWLFPLLAFPFTAYGLLFILLPLTAFNAILEQFDAFNKGQLRMLGLCEAAVGAMLAVAGYATLWVLNA